MGFDDRLGTANTCVRVVKAHIWDVEPLKSRLSVVDYGHETHITPEIRETLRFARSITTKHIRFTPNFFVVEKSKPEEAYLLEYKAIQTPLYPESRSRRRCRECGTADLKWEDIGQMEADAYDNYKRLADSGVRVAVLNYCAFHPRPLLCDFVERIGIIDRFTVRSWTTKGS